MLRKLFWVIPLMALTPGAFAIDGVVLINQSTVMATGGFPYVISQPGSYKLSGNLTIDTTPAGNYAPLGSDVAIVIAHSNVLLDLNGFSITVTNTNGDLSHDWFAIADNGSCPGSTLSCTYEQIVIRNGAITMRSVANRGAPMGLAAGLNLRGSASNLLEDLTISVRGGFAVGGPLQVIGDTMRIGPHSVIRHNVLFGLLLPTCPSVVTENDTRNFSSGYPAGLEGPCVSFLNIP